MKKPSKKPDRPDARLSDEALTRLIGLGDRSIRKSYYPQLKKKITELETFQIMVDRAAEAILFLSLNDDPPRIEYANYAALVTLGMDMETLHGKRLADIFSKTVDEDLTKVLDAESRETIQTDHNGRTLEMTVTRHGINGQPHAVVLARDITARIRAERELRQVQTLLTGIVESMPSALIGLNMNGLVTLWNRQAEELTGTASEDAQGRPLGEVFPRLANQMPYVERAVREMQPQLQSRVMHHKNGHLRFEDITVYPLSDRDNGGAVLRIDDVTKRVQMEEMMVQSEKMMSVGGLAAGMAHEINNPLGGILQGTQNIMRRLYDDIPANLKAAENLSVSLDEIRAYMSERNIPAILEGIRTSGQRAARIVSNMLDFSRKSDSQMAPNDVNGILDRALELATSDYNLKKRYDFKKIRIERAYDSGLPPVRCSATEIEQVVLNLLANAAHAMAEHPEPEGGRLIRLTTASRNGSVHIRIEDNGPGMDEATRKQAFEPFFTTKAPGLGTGLGLSVSYYIITQNHGGEFTVESTPGQGTRFAIRLPLD